MNYYKHKTKEIYLVGDVLQWQEERMLREKVASGDKTNFIEIPYEQYRRWRIHEVYWDSEMKSK